MYRCTHKGTSPWSSRQGALSPTFFADFRPSIADFRLRPGPQSCDTWRLPAPFGSMKVCSDQRGLLFFHLLKNMQKTTGFKGNLSLGIFLDFPGALRWPASGHAGAAPGARARAGGGKGRAERHQRHLRRGGPRGGGHGEGHAAVQAGSRSLQGRAI